MKVIAELELSGDFGDNLTFDEIQDMISEVFQSGAESCSCNGNAKLIEVREN